jgi:hypothetical protein
MLGITLARKSGADALNKRLKSIFGNKAAYVGVPASTSKDRKAKLLDMAGRAGKKKAAKLKKAAEADVSNAELLFIHTKGSPIRGIPARPVIQPAIEADGNHQKISRELASSAKAYLEGSKEKGDKFMLRAALAGQNAARKWFTDSRNGWAPNAASTIAAKGSDRPLIDTGALRQSIIGIVRTEE